MKGKRHDLVPFCFDCARACDVEDELCLSMPGRTRRRPCRICGGLVGSRLRRNVAARAVARVRQLSTLPPPGALP